MTRLETVFGVRNYLHKLLLGVFISAFVLTAQKAQASHSMGADLTYRNIGGNTYQFTLSFYRDCFGILPEDSVQLACSSSCFPVNVIYLVLDSGTGVEITPNCPTAITTCNGGNYTGIQQYIYHGTVTLDGACTDWLFEFDQCCRNAAITNIERPGETAMHIYATLNNVDATINNSPTFSNQPVPFACLGQNFCYNHGAFDPDGDSLSFSLITPYSSTGLFVRYNWPFSANNPLTTDTTLSFNPRTGDICMTPSNLEVTVMAVLVNEYRNGVLIGSVERDIQVTVINCNNLLPALTGINGTNSYFLSVCAGTQACFDIFSRDSDAAQHTTISWDNNIAGATFTTVSGHRETASFCWTPGQDRIGTNPYCFTATVHDDNCPLYGNQTYSYCITVRGLNVNAGPDRTVGCNANTSLTATASGGSGNFSYLWNNGQTTASISSGPGNYIVTVSDGRCLNYDTARILPGNVVPLADFSIVKSCSSLSVQFHNLSTIVAGTINSFRWNFGDGGTSILPDPLHVYAATGIYPVSLIVQSAGGCVDTIVQIINLSSNRPIAAFSSNSACSNTPINFLDHSTSTSAITNWLWRFGDGRTSTIPSPAHSFTTSGIFPVTQIITNISGCIDSITQPITVFYSPHAFAGPDDSICMGSSDTLIASGGDSYSWLPGGEDSSTIVITPITNQLYIVEVTDTNQCKARDSVMIRLKPPATAYAGNNQLICAGDSVLLQGIGDGNFLWSPGGSTSLLMMVSPATSTTYTLSAINSYGCTASDNVLVIVNPIPVANAGLNQSICAGRQITLHASGGGSYHWLPIGSNSSTPIVSPPVTTTYTVVVSYSNTCSDTDQVTIFVNPMPTVSFTNPDSACMNATIQFTDHSLVSSGSLSWHWNFGNSVSSDLENPNAVYSSAGNYNVSLVVTSDGGCIDSAQTQVSIIPSPVASFLVAGICLNDTSRFINLSGISNNEPLNFQWNFGDTTGSSNNNPLHVYAHANTFHPTLLVVSATGCADSASVPIAVYPLPVAGFAIPLLGCTGTAFIFTDASTVESGNIAYWNWLNGSTTFSTVENPGTIFPDSGVYVYSLIVTTNAGCVDSISSTSTIAPSPIPAFHATETCLGQSVQFDNTTQIPGGEPVSYQWNFGDPTQFSGTQNPSHNYADFGNFHVVLVVSSSRGCVDSVSTTITVHPIPQAKFSNVTSCEGNPVNFHDQSVIPADAIISWNWKFGDQVFSSLEHPSHVFASFGDYTVQLNVISSFGCSDSIILNQHINPNPVIDYKGQSICLGDYMRFINRSSIPVGAIAQWQWFFGDGTTSYQNSPVHLYSEPGIYNVQLTAYSDSSCRASLLIPSSAMVNSIPVADFITGNQDFSEIYSTVNFINHSTDAALNQWSFGDGSFSSSISPVHTFGKTGTFEIVLIVTNQSGCIDSISSTIEVKPSVTIFVPNAFTPNGDGINDRFHAYFLNMVKMDARIYDRWGVKIAEWDDLNGYWDGTTNEKQAPSDVYIYRIEYTGIDGSSDVLVGRVSLVR